MEIYFWRQKNKEAARVASLVQLVQYLTSLYFANGHPGSLLNNNNWSILYCALRTVFVLTSLSAEVSSHGHEEGSSCTGQGEGVLGRSIWASISSDSEFCELGSSLS